MTKKLSGNPSVALIGAGAMGGALLKGWLAAGTIDPATSAVFDPNANDAMKALCAEHGLALNSNGKSFDTMVLAVKPQAADTVLPGYVELAKHAIVVSVMAGKSIAKISALLNGVSRVARVMPNLPAAIGKGVSGLYAPDSIDSDGRALIEKLMRAAGETVWVDTEQGIDFVTAVSGSGPAYFFLLTEALAEAGAKLGLTPQAAAALARATLSGSGALIAQETRTPEEMRKTVTSPGGTTAAALAVFDGDDQAMRTLVAAAVKAAAKRASELTE
ncbi:pyrroline-5-carboxylate reductase [Hyphococcus sp.]|uniref:pyrroline-5-carboxylate reductase n=1 Tax=Hyphococcus sp. TaxID=2038636 RepID=UPI002087CB46|nr:MAG: pyrroline-5-carboxylate reductase [Marinicaulis sp.]